MKERPILMSAPMVRAILAGRKTQTRRIVKRHKAVPLDYILNPSLMVDTFLAWWQNPVYDRVGFTQECPYGQPGDRLWVREAWRTYESLDSCKPRNIIPGAGIQYEAGGTNLSGDGGKYLFGAGRLRPSMFMPRWVSRITLEIVSVRVERLQDISEQDALAEGVNVHSDHHGKPRTSIYSPVQAYADLWESINGAGSWEANPWVWVVEFKRVRP